MSQNPKTYFSTESHAVAYKKFRDVVPKAVVDRIVNFVSQKKEFIMKAYISHRDWDAPVTFDPSECVAVDVGCGSGQSTLPLAPYFKQIYAYDTSIAQINEIQKKNQIPNVLFQKADAESLPMPDTSVHLVTAMHAVHWFDIEAFLKEVDRILVPKGVLALVVATYPTTIKGFEEETAAHYHKFTERTTKYRDERIVLVRNRYKDIHIPYDECIRDESIATEEEVTVAHIVEHMKTFSSIVKYFRDKPKEAEEALENYKQDLLKLLGSTRGAEETNVTLLRQYTVVLARKPNSKH